MAEAYKKRDELSSQITLHENRSVVPVGERAGMTEDEILRAREHTRTDSIVLAGGVVDADFREIPDVRYYSANDVVVDDEGKKHFLTFELIWRRQRMGINGLHLKQRKQS